MSKIKNPMWHKEFFKEPAMTQEETVRAMAVGMELVRTLKRKDTGYWQPERWGIGNTTTSSAMAALLKCEVPLVTGKGAGLSEKGLLHKQGSYRTGNPEI